MKKWLAIVLAFLITGCSVPYKKPKFPDIPPSLNEPCGDLVLVEQGETKLSEVLKVVTINYGSYNICRAKVDSWLMWYNEQKKINEEIK